MGNADFTGDSDDLLEECWLNIHRGACILPQQNTTIEGTRFLTPIITRIGNYRD